MSVQILWANLQTTQVARVFKSPMFPLKGGCQGSNIWRHSGGGDEEEIDESLSDSGQVHRAKELYMSGAKQLQIMNNLRTRYCYRMYGSAGHGVLSSQPVLRVEGQ